MKSLVPCPRRQPVDSSEAAEHSGGVQCEEGAPDRSRESRFVRPRLKLTALESKRIYAPVRRLGPTLALLLIALWVPGELSWALALMASASGSHHVSLRASCGDVDVVLHHHPVSSSSDDPAWEADDHSHADHVIHGSGTARLHQETLLQQGAAAHFSVAGDLRLPRIGDGRTLLHVEAVGPSPPLRTVVLRI